MVVFCVGIYFAIVLVYFSWTHLHKQLYTLYLSRGGEPVPLSPKLNDAPATDAGGLRRAIGAATGCRMSRGFTHEDLGLCSALGGINRRRRKHPLRNSTPPPQNGSRVSLSHASTRNIQTRSAMC